MFYLKISKLQFGPKESIITFVQSYDFIVWNKITNTR